VHVVPDARCVPAGRVRFLRTSCGGAVPWDGMAGRDVLTARSGRLVPILLRCAFIFGSNKQKMLLSCSSTKKTQTPLVFQSAHRARRRLPSGDHQLIYNTRGGGATHTPAETAAELQWRRTRLTAPSLPPSSGKPRAGALPHHSR
jgi:hypothetical protein